MTRSKLFSALLVIVISVLLIVAGCAPAATAPAPAKPAEKPAATTPAATTPAEKPATSTPPPTKPEEKPAAKELTFKAATYTNDAEGFSVKYPEDWAKDTDEFKYMVYGAKSATILPRMLVYIYPTTSDDELVKLADEGFKDNNGSNVKRDVMEKMQLGANSGLYTLVNWDYAGGAYNLDTYSFSVIHNGKYVVVATTTMSGIPKYETLSKEIFSTLTFK